MSDFCKLNDEGRPIYFLFSDIATISTCYGCLLDPSGAESSFALSSFSGTLEINGVDTAVVGYTGDLPQLSQSGNWTAEIYIETTDGYKGRREAIQIPVYANYENYEVWTG